jgi:hypothetical protein
MSSAPTRSARSLAIARNAVFDPEVRNVEREAYAVEREAYALERESGGSPFVESSLRELMTAAWAMAESEEDEFESTEAAWQELLDAARLTQHFCRALQRRLVNHEQELFLDEWTPRISEFCLEVERQIGPRTGRKPRKAKSKPAKAE